MDCHLEATPLLDYDHASIQSLIVRRGWKDLAPYDAIGAVYDFVREEIPFGYNRSDEITASEVLRDGYGQCNTKGTLLMALFRGVGIPCRFHGFTIDKSLQRGAISGFAYWIAPKNIVHSWVEVLHAGSWLNLEGFILDTQYLDGVRARFPEASGEFCAFAIGTKDIRNPPVEWTGRDTYIQHTGINRDFGVFDSPDAFYERHGSNLSGIRGWFYAHAVRHWINATVRGIRRQRSIQRSGQAASMSARRDAMPS